MSKPMLRLKPMLRYTISQPVYGTSHINGTDGTNDHIQNTTSSESKTKYLSYIVGVLTILGFSYYLLKDITHKNFKEWIDNMINRIDGALSTTQKGGSQSHTKDINTVFSIMDKSKEKFITTSGQKKAYDMLKTNLTKDGPITDNLFKKILKSISIIPRYVFNNIINLNKKTIIATVLLLNYLFNPFQPDEHKEIPAHVKIWICIVLLVIMYLIEVALKMIKSAILNTTENIDSVVYFKYSIDAPLNVDMAFKSQLLKQYPNMNPNLITL
jgi:hypothetical protein